MCVKNYFIILISIADIYIVVSGRGVGNYSLWIGQDEGKCAYVGIGKIILSSAILDFVDTLMYLYDEFQINFVED